MADDELTPDDLELDVASDAGGEDDAPEQDDSVDDQDSQDQDPKITEKRLKDTQAALTKKAQENAELKSKFDQLNGKLEMLLQQQQAKTEKKEEEPNEFQFLDDEAEQQKLLDDPKNVATTFKRVLAGLGTTLQKRDAYLLGEVKKLVQSNTSDEGRIVSATVQKLRQDSDYQAFSDEQLAVLAKKQIAAKAAKAKQKDNFKGGAGGNSGYRGTSTGNDDTDAEVNRFLKMLYPKDKFDDKE